MGKDSLLTQTVARHKGCRRLVVTGREWEDLARREVGFSADVVCEPARRGTLGAICFALASSVYRADDLILVVPSDGAFDMHSLNRILPKAKELAHTGNIVTFGVEPTHAETGYGYIRRGANHTVAEFTEKPSLDLAEYFWRCGEYLWNAGMFLFEVGTFTRQVAEFAPQFSAFLEGRCNFLDLEGESIDVGILEKSDRVAVVPIEGSWTDVGTWEGVYQAGVKDENGNVVLGNVEVENVQDSLIVAARGAFCAHDFSGMCVVDSPEGTLIRRLSSTSVNIKAHNPQ